MNSRIETRPFGQTSEGEEVTLFRLSNASGAFAEVLDYGGILRSVVVPDRENNLIDVCLGFDTPEAYDDNDGYLSALVGRCCNRIAGSRFTLDDREYTLSANKGRHHLHGGLKGFNRYRWDHRLEDGALVLSRLSPDGEEGYPGNLQVEARYTFTEKNELIIGYEAVSDQDTVVNLTCHAYWNLLGHGAGDVGGHTLQINAAAYTENDEDSIPNGVLASVVGTPFDLRTPKPLNQGWEADNDQIKIAHGYDQNWVLSGSGERTAAVLGSPESGITLTVATTQPGLQLYTANWLPELTGKGGAAYGRRRGVALETQGYPDAVHHPEFPSVVLKAGETYRARTVFTFSNRMGMGGTP